MKLRKLQYRDAPLMLEWMHDPLVVKNLLTNFESKTLKDCELFINRAQNTSENLHLAIVNDDDVYMGTVSLKSILNKTAEFAITIRKTAMGKGYSIFGMKEIIRIGFEVLDLKFIYWCVDPMNKRAVRFYDKNAYQRINVNNQEIAGYTKEQRQRFIWYGIDK
ncbi:MAG TPA: GNAT family N-acetyltransferase [Candidatus Mediterraneibacter surreyensis]|nr:GNAT family N-acetyltransferase [Candidatus Mediterraneibacter surreyensis]